MQTNNLLLLTKKNLYSFNNLKKKKIFNNYFTKLAKHHYLNCEYYKNFLNNYKFNFSKQSIELLPPLHVNLFKEIDLVSVNEKKISSVLFSSGTSMGSRSKIFIDQKTSILQKKVLNQIFDNNISKNRLPIFFFERKNILSKSDQMNAKMAAISGFSLFGSKIEYILDKDNKFDEINFINKVKKINTPFLVFGFTFDIYEQLIEKFKLKFDKNIFRKGILLHGGGWKKLENKKINNDKFNNKIIKKFKFKKIINYYGLIEQAGSIFFSCQYGFFHTTFFSDIDIMNENLNIAKFKKKGIVQLKSLIPYSYPGHKIITEDVGMIYGEDDCKCQRKGKYFKIFGRVKKSQIRGCSNV